MPIFNPKQERFCYIKNTPYNIFSVDNLLFLWYNLYAGSEGRIFAGNIMPDKAQTEMSVPYPAFILWRKCMIRLSDHFTYAKVLRFALPSVVMMIFTSIYSVVDGFFVSNTDIKFNKLHVMFKAFYLFVFIINKIMFGIAVCLGTYCA